MESPRILIMAGGTGGHVFPALAVARALIAEGADVCWLGTRQGLEAKIVPKDNIPIEWISVYGLRGKGIVSWLSAPFKLLKAVMQAMQVVRRYQPNVVLGMGGFASGPGGFAAWLLKKPLLVHEQNAVAGLTNKLLAPLAVTVLQAFPSAFSKRKNTLTTGNPVRNDIATIAAPEIRFAERDGPLRVLVVGGSLGAQILNERMPKALKMLPEYLRPDVWHQTGLKHLSDTQQQYHATGMVARVEPFVENMAEAYAWSDMVVCRSGALTVSELAAAGVAAILVPYPYAVDDHQTENAKYLSDQGAAILIQQNQLSVEKLSELLSEYAGEVGRNKLLSMAKVARRLAKIEATALVVSQCMEVAHV